MNSNMFTRIASRIAEGKAPHSEVVEDMKNWAKENKNLQSSNPKE